MESIVKCRGLLNVLAFLAIISAHSAGAQVAVNLTYNADGYIVAKTVNGVTTQYLVDEMWAM